jgi:hypothetical protein
MASGKRAAAAIAALVLLAPRAAAGQEAVVPGVFLVKNNTSEPLRCRYRMAGFGWSKPFRLRPGAQFERPAAPFTTLRFFCERPAERRTYVIRAGGRHSMLRAADGSIVMREIDV